MIRGSFSLIIVILIRTVYLASLPILYSLWALESQHRFSTDIKWAAHWGALLPSSQMTFTESWRVFSASLLHIDFSHLLSNLILLMVALLLQCWRTKHNFYTTQSLSLTYFFKSFHEYLAPIYLLCWGGLVSTIRVFMGIEAWSLGLSGVAMMYLSQTCTCLAYQFTFCQYTSVKRFTPSSASPSRKLHYIKMIALFLLPWLLAFSSLDADIDLSSHLIGTGLGCIYGIWKARYSCSCMSGESGKI